MAEASQIAYLLERMTRGVAAHDRENPGHHTWGIGMAHFDIERWGLEDGEEIPYDRLMLSVGPSS